MYLEDDGRDIAVLRSLPSTGKHQMLCLFDVEQIAEAGEVEHLAHRLSNIAHDHISLALHSLQSAEQNTQSRAGDVFELSKIQSQLLCVADDLIDLGFEVGRCYRVKSSLKQKCVFCSVFFSP